MKASHKKTQRQKRTEVKRLRLSPWRNPYANWQANRELEASVVRGSTVSADGEDFVVVL